MVTRTPGLAGGPGKPTGSNPGRAPRSDPTAICLLAYIYLAIAVALQRRQEAGSDLDAGLVPITVPELRLLRDTVIPPPRRDRPHRLHWSTW